MKSIATITVLAFFALTKANSQTVTTVTGNVKDEKKSPLTHVMVSLLKIADSSLVKTGISDTKGNFEIPARKAGSYLLSYASLGYETTYSKPF